MNPAMSGSVTTASVDLEHLAEAGGPSFAGPLRMPVRSVDLPLEFQCMGAVRPRLVHVLISTVERKGRSVGAAGITGRIQYRDATARLSWTPIPFRCSGAP